MAVERAASTASALADGRVLVAGGYGVVGGQTEHLSSVEAYEAVT